MARWTLGIAAVLLGCSDGATASTFRPEPAAIDAGTSTAPRSCSRDGDRCVGDPCCVGRSAQRLDVARHCLSERLPLGCHLQAVDAKGVCSEAVNEATGCVERALEDGGVEILVTPESNLPAGDFGVGFHECSPASAEISAASQRGCD